MNRFKIIQGDTLNLAVHNVRIELVSGSFYTITPKDKIVFVLSIRDKPVIVKTYPQDMSYIGGSTLLLKLESEETKTLNCLSYNFEFKIDIGSVAEQVYTIAKGTMEVLASVEGDSG